MGNKKSIYTSLNICQCEFNENLPQKKKVLNDLGSTTGVFLNIYLPVNSAFVSGMSDKIILKIPPFYIPNIPTITLGVNYGIIAYLFKKAEGKSDKRATSEATFEFLASWQVSNAGNFLSKKLVTAEVTKTLATRTATRLGITMAGRILGGYVGSVIPIAGTIIGAIAGAWLAGKVEEWWFSEEDKQLAQDKAENERIERLEKEYKLKIDRINDYLVRYHYIELRELSESESQILCKEASNLKSSYFKTIMLMQSFPNYLDKDKVFYKTLQENALDISKDSKETDKAESKEPKITPITNAIPLTIEIEKCHNGISGNLLRNTTIYMYNHRFKRIVAKGQSDGKGKLVAHNVSVGREYTIDKLSFIADRNNFDESNFELSLHQYESFTNIQKHHKKAKKLKLLQAYFSFNGSKLSFEYEYEVSNLKAHIYKDTIELIPTHNLKDTRFHQYIKYSYMVFDITDNNIDEKISNITIANRAMLGLKNLGNGGVGGIK